MEGQVERIAGATVRARALATYLKRYPFVREFFPSMGGISSLVAKKMTGVDLYAFRPSHILYTDNDAGFGTRWKLQVQEGMAVGDPILV